MKALLDTHAFLWWIADDARLSPRVIELITDGANRLFLSAASGWEMAIKAKLGKLELPAPVAAFVDEQLRTNGIESLPIQMRHALHVFELPPHHRDPFDRLLIAQAQLERMPILSSDPQLALYPVEVIW